MRTTAAQFLAVAACLLLAWQATPAPAVEFRMQSEVYRGKEKEPVSESLTLFKGGVVYDFSLPEATEITMFDPVHGRFVLLDCRRNVKTILSTAEVLAFLKNLHEQPEFAKQAYLFDPKFKESYDAKTHWLTLDGESQPISYRAKLLNDKPADPEIATEYRKFADWYSRLNAVKGNLHTLARIPLNRAIANHESVPEEVELTIDGRVGKAEVRSRHLFNWVLSANDVKRIAKVGECNADFDEVPFAEFKASTKVAGKGK